jgi:hypothetical protein
MYTTLKPRTNMALVFVSAGVAVTALLFTRPVPVTPALIGQSRSMRAAPSTFQQAQTAMDVRRALTSTVPGKRAIQVQWVGAFILLGAGLWIGNPLGGWVTGYALLMCARDLVALRAVGQLAHSGVP